jgi:hypothetical protein
MKWQTFTGPYIAPYIYLISSNNVIYIGETQKIPVLRWGSHLSTGGSFLKRLKQKGDPDINYIENLQFISRKCDWIMDNFHQSKWRLVSQAIEHVLHETISSDPRLFGKYLKVISDTEKTAPRGFREWDLVRSVSNDMIISLKKEFVCAC